MLNVSIKKVPFLLLALSTICPMSLTATESIDIAPEQRVRLHVRLAQKMQDVTYQVTEKMKEAGQLIVQGTQNAIEASEVGDFFEGIQEIGSDLGSDIVATFKSFGQFIEHTGDRIDQATQAVEFFIEDQASKISDASAASVEKISSAFKSTYNRLTAPKKSA